MKILSRKLVNFLLILIVICLFCFPFASGVFAINEENTVYLGGCPLGVMVKSDGVTVINLTDVITKEGLVSPAKEGGLKKGDLILKIDDFNISSHDDIAKSLVNNPESVKISIKRDNQILELNVKPKLDLASNKTKIGLQVKNEIAGIGTLTYVRKDNHRFGGLGHQIFDATSTNNSIYNNGSIHKASIIGHLKGEAGKAGELRGTFVRNELPIGKLDKNTFAGIFGVAEENMYYNLKSVVVATKSDIKLGKAYIYTTIEGNEPKQYEIEIVKAISQNEPSEKSMVIKVTDKELLERTGGIVQGMSGSPIIQNNKLIGAVTHVFVNDPSRGYGIYIDWMIGN